MKKIIEGYLESQKTHLDSLKNIFYLNSDLTNVSEEITNAFLETTTNITALNEKLASFELSINMAEFELIKERIDNLQNIENVYKEILIKITEKYQENKNELNQKFDNQIKEIDNKIKGLENEKLAKLTETNNLFESSLQKLKKDNLLIDNKLVLEKRNYLRKTSLLSKELETKLAALKNDFKVRLDSFEKLENQIIAQTNILINDIENEYSEFSKKHKENILNNKQNYYNSTEVINNKINDVNKNYKTLIDKNQTLLNLEINKLNDENEKFLKQVQSEVRLVLDAFENQLIKIDNKIDDLKKAHEAQENILKAHYNKDITSINILFQTEKNEYTKQLNDAIKDFNEQKAKQITLSQSYENSFLKYKKQIENSLAILENITQSKILERRKIYFKDLFYLNKKYLKKQAIYRSLRFIKDEKKNASLKYFKRKQDIHDLNFSLIANLTNNLYKYEKNIIESKQSIEIHPLDMQVSNARLLHFNESGLLSLEQSYRREAFLNSKSTILYQSHLELLSLKLESTLLKNNYTYELNNLHGDNYLAIQYEKNIYDGHVKEEFVTKYINEAIHDLKTLQQKHKDDIFIIEYNSKVEKETAKLKVDLEKKNIEETILKEQLTFEMEKLKLNKQKDINANKALETIKTSALENDHLQNILKTFFDILDNFSNERALFFELLSNINNNDEYLLKQSLDIFKELLTNQLSTSSTILAELLNRLTKQIKNNIEAHKLTEFDQKYKQIIDESEETKAKVTTKLEEVNEEIKNVRNSVLIDYQLIETLEAEITDFKNTKLIIARQIKGLKHHFDAQSKKTIKQLKVQYNSLTNKIASHKQLIKNSNQIIKEKNDQLTLLNNSLAPLEHSFNNLDDIKNAKVKELELNHSKETNPLYQTTLDLEDTIKKFNELSFSLLEEFANIRATYLNSKDGSLDKRISYFFQTIDNSFNDLHQTISLLLEHLYIYSKKEQLKIEQEFTNNYQLSLSYLDKNAHKDLKVYNTQLKELDSYLNTLYDSFDQALKRRLVAASKVQKKELKTASLNIRELKDEKRNIAESNKQLLIAFNLNQNEVKKLTKKEHSNQLKNIKKEINLEIKQIQDEIKKNLLEANSKEKSYKNRIITLANKDKANKAKLTSSLTRRKTINKNKIKKNTDLIKKTSAKITKTTKLRDFKIKASKKVLTKYQERKIYKIKRTLKKTIASSTKDYKVALKKSLIRD